MRLPLSDGKYWVTCRERAMFATTTNGHGHVFFGAEGIAKDGWASFTRERVKMWNCSARYVAAHFDVQPASGTRR